MSNNEKNPIVFIHGVGLTKEIWEPQINFFKDYNTLTYDLLGHGKTPLKKSKVSLDDFSKQLTKLINELRKKNHGQTIRLALLGTHYRQPLDWTNELINSSKNILDKWYEQYTKVNETNLFDKDILKPLLDDLNTPAYISNLHVLYEKAKKGSEKEKIQFN